MRLDDVLSINRSEFMTDSIHGHEVMRKMIDSGQVYTEGSLRAAINTWFGETARFHTCSTENMSAAGLIAFLAEKRKFHSNDIGFKVNEDAICGDA
jgi:probable metal-binding protein